MRKTLIRAVVFSSLTVLLTVQPGAAADAIDQTLGNITGWVQGLLISLGVLGFVLGAAFFITGSYVATVRIGRQAHVFQLDDIPRLVGLVFLSPAGLIVTRLVGAALALTVARLRARADRGVQA